MPDLTLPEAIVIVGLVFAWIAFVVARAYFENR
jgi:hypothetical protein